MSKKIKLTDFTPDDKNFNKHNQYGMSLLEKSVEKIGVIESITVSSDNKVISGNARQEIMTQKFDGIEPIIVETDGKRPVILKRNDIVSGTKEFHEAAILANTVSKHNINLDTDLIQEVAVETYNIDIEELGVDFEQEKEYRKNVEDISNMIAVSLNDEESEIWLSVKERIGKRNDKHVIFALIKNYLNETDSDT